MRLSERCLRAGAVVAGLAGCGESERPASLPPGTTDVVIVSVDRPAADRPAVTPDLGFDAGAAPTDLGAADANAAGFDVDLNRRYPAGPVGGAVGNVPTAFTLPDCLGGPYAFSGADFLRSRATVLAVFTGSCPTCAADARALATLANELRPRAVRVVAVLIEGTAPMEIPSGGFCARWRTDATATHPVLIDASRSLAYLNPLRAWPLILVIDGAGYIRGRYAAQADWLSNTRSLLGTLAP